ncbi:MAG TPA: DMT family transporter [Dyella sp.]|uniref:DMT family transporter n=1 Tax=Dyella sp. TaxID=1869338 RepID=UPI002F93419E
MKRQTIAGLGNGIAAGSCWGLVFLAPRVLEGFAPIQLSAARYLVYGAIAMLLLLPRWRRLAARLTRREWWALVGLSLLGNIVYYILLARAVQMAGGAAASLIVGLLPVAVTVFGSFETGAVPLRALRWPLLLCLTGVVLVGMASLRTDTAQRDVGARSIGLLCAFGALTCWTVYSIWNGRWLQRRPDLSAHDWSLLTGMVTGLLALGLAVPAFLPPSEHAPVAWMHFWGLTFIVALLASVVGNACWNRASRLLPLTLVGQMIVFETLFALLYVFIYEQRWPGTMEILAIACLVVGVVGCARAHR